MKYLSMLAAILLLFSCAPKEETPAEERSIGFLTSIPDTKWHLGTEAAIDIVKAVDKLWAAKDYDGIRPYLSDTSKFYFEDGRVADSPEAFINELKKETGWEFSWTFDYAYSVDLDPTQGGEHVQAGFTGTGTKDSVTLKRNYHESYYIIQGKIVWWNQYSQKVRDEAASDAEEDEGDE